MKKIIQTKFNMGNKKIITLYFIYNKTFWYDCILTQTWELLEVILSHVFLNRKTTVLCNNGGIIRPRHHVFVKNNCMGTQSIHNNCCGIKREREKMRLFSLAFRWCCVCKAFSCGEYESSSATKCSPFRWLYLPIQITCMDIRFLSID